MFQIRLKMLRESRGLSQYSFADQFGVSQAAVGHWEAGKREPNFSTMQRIADFFGVSVDYLLGRDDSTVPPVPSVPGGKWVPVLGAVPAGIPIEAVEEILDYEEISAQTAAQGEHFALRVKGASMEPRMRDGDTVIVRMQSDAETGDTCVVLVNGNEATVKRIKKEAGGIWLLPNNPAFDSVFYPQSEIDALPVRILGRVIELRGKL